MHLLGDASSFRGARCRSSGNGAFWGRKLGQCALHWAATAINSAKVSTAVGTHGRGVWVGNRILKRGPLRRQIHSLAQSLGHFMTTGI